VRRTAQHKRAVRRRATAALTVGTAVIIVALLAVSSPFLGTHHRDLPVGPPASHPTRFAGLPPVGARASLPADGTLVFHIGPHSVGDEPGISVFADGRIIWQRWSSAGDPLVIPEGADPFQTGYVQQRLTTRGVQLLLARILRTGEAAGLFRRNLELGHEAHGMGFRYTVCNDGHLVYAEVLSPEYLQHPPTMVTAAQMSALAEISSIVADPSSVVPANAWADRTIRPYVPSRYDLMWDRSQPNASKLPSPAKEALARLLPDADRGITTDQARALLAAFAQSGVKVLNNHALHLSFELPAVSSPTTEVALRIGLPGSPLSDSNRC
jgi:hypothetical protein